MDGTLKLSDMHQEGLKNPTTLYLACEAKNLLNSTINRNST